MLFETDREIIAQLVINTATASEYTEVISSNIAPDYAPVEV